MKYQVYNGENININETLRNLFFIVVGWSLNSIKNKLNKQKSNIYNNI